MDYYKLSLIEAGLDTIAFTCKVLFEDAIPKDFTNKKYYVLLSPKSYEKAGELITTIDLVDAETDEVVFTRGTRSYLTSGLKNKGYYTIKVEKQEG